LVGGKAVQVEALGPELIHGGVYMKQHTTEAVVLVWIALHMQTIRYKKHVRMM
jgi:hypothetical protein